MREGDKDGLKHFMESGMKCVLSLLLKTFLSTSILFFLQQWHRNIALLQTVPWVARLAWRIPKAAGRIVSLRDWSITYAKRRNERGSTVKDVFHHLVSCIYVFDHCQCRRLIRPIEDKRR